VRSRALIGGLLAGAAIGLAPATAAAADFSVLADPFAGTAQWAPDFGTGGGAGNTAPAATVPFGMVQLGPDTLPSTVNFAGGYSYVDHRIRGFSLTHLSGAGCAIFQDLPILPVAGAIRRSPVVPGSSDLRPEVVAAFSHRDEAASPGRYRVRLNPGGPRAIGVALTATPRTGAMRVRMPARGPASMILNAGGSAMANGDASVRIDPARREVSGTAASGRFCFQRNVYAVHFVARFSRPFASYATWRRGELRPGSRAASDHSPSPFNYKPIPGGPASLPGNPSSTAQAGAALAFDPRRGREVEVRVGISYVSVAGARRNLERESAGRSFASLQRAASGAWRSAIGRVSVRGGARRDRRMLATALYDSMLHPNLFSDADGRYQGFDGAVHRSRRPRYTNVSGWDVYRSQVPLLALLAPRVAGDLADSLLAQARESGWLAKWPYAASQTNVMGGDPAAPILATLHALGVRSFDARAALRAMVKGATRTGRSANAGYVERPGLEAYLRLGYVPRELDNGGATTGGAAAVVDPALVWGSAATTLEYASADFAISRLARALGDRATAAAFLRRAGNWRLLLNRSSGLIEPKRADGAFLPGYVGASGEGFMEGNAFQYTWMVPFDLGGLASRLGGPAAAAARLDRLHRHLNAGPLAPYAYLGNEPGLITPWVYDWLGRPWRTQAVVREALDRLYRPAPGGMPGNADAGTLPSWWVFGALGLYPAIPGTGVLAIGSPLFPRVDVRLRGGTLRITAPGAARGHPYVRGMTVDERRWSRPWLDARRIARGASLRFDLGARPDRRWGSSAAGAPPSFAP